MRGKDEQVSTRKKEKEIRREEEFMVEEKQNMSPLKQPSLSLTMEVKRKGRNSETC